jgi:hypothetical protein
MAKSEQQVLRELVKLRRAMLRKEANPQKKKILREWVKEGVRQLRMHKHGRKRVR